MRGQAGKRGDDALHLVGDIGGQELWSWASAVPVGRFRRSGIGSQDNTPPARGSGEMTLRMKLGLSAAWEITL